VRVGIVILPELRWAEARHRWRRAEAYGFHHAWTYDHLGWRDLVDGPWFDAVPTLTAAATVTSRIRLGTLVASANFRHPVHFVREITALDDIAGGRLLLGLGAGGGGFDAQVLGSAPMQGTARIDRYGEFVELLDRLLRQDRTTWQGRYYTALDARSAPGTVQRPRVPFILAGNARRSIAIAARFGDGWITTGERCEDVSRWWASVADRAKLLDELLAACDRPAQSIGRYLSLDAGPGYSLSSAAAFEEAYGRARQLGFTDAIVHWPRANGWYAGDERVLDDVAEIASLTG
jgi:alkanesulfonate monooxygenase SsuD/methylene tetrahydromethanopterin reductase-like flavin-dependent oxidoreductase (luciferase family)